MLPIIAQKAGIFESHRLDAKYKYLQTGKTTLDAVVRGDLQFGVIVEATMAFAAFEAELDVVVIAVNQEKFDDALIARTDKGISIADDIVGKRIGITRGTNSQMYTFRFLEKHRIPPAKVTLVNLSPPAIVAALTNGEIDGGAVWQPFRFYLNKQLGDKIVNFTNTGIYKGYAVIAVNQEFARRNGDIVERFLRSLIDAEQFARNGRATAINILAREIDIESTVLDKVWHEYNLQVALPNELVNAMADEGRWIVQNEQGFRHKQVPDYQRVVDLSFLQRIDPQRVQ